MGIGHPLPSPFHSSLYMHTSSREVLLGGWVWVLDGEGDKIASGGQDHNDAPCSGRSSACDRLTLLRAARVRAAMPCSYLHHAMPSYYGKYTVLLCISLEQQVRIKKTRIFMRSARSEALRTIHDLIPAGSEDIRMVRKFQILKSKRCMQNHNDAM